MNKSIQKTIAVINQKGGVGKTTISINLATGLAQNGYNTLLVDLDPQAHSTIGLGIDLGSYGYDIHNVLVHKKNILDIILPTGIDKLSLAPASIHLEKAEWDLFKMFRSERFLYRALRNLAFDFVVLDCRPTLGTLTINAVYSSDYVLVPCTTSRFSLEGFADLLETYDMVKNDEEEERPKVHDLKIVVNMLDPRKTIMRDWMFEELKPYQELLLETIIRQDDAINKAQAVGQPVVCFQPNSRGANDFNLLTREFLSICRQTSENN